MKKSLLYLTLLLASIGAWAQSVPQIINYQGIARRASGSTINNQSLGLQFKITKMTSSAVVFTEAQTKGSNALGLFSTQIGNGGTPAFSTIDWSAGPYLLEVSIDTTGGTNYVSLGTQPLASVPYALAAPSPTLAYNNNILSVGNNTVGIFVGGASPSLSISGNTISITGGNSVPLPGVTATNVTASGASSITPITGGINIHTDSVTVSPRYYGTPPTGIVGIGQVGGNWPNYTIIVDPLITYDPNLGLLNLSNNALINIGIPNLTNQVYSVNYPVAPNVVLTGNILSVGPKTVDINPIAPWRWDVVAQTATLAGIAIQSVGINNTQGVAPTAELEVTGYTKLGSNTAPGIKMLKLIGTTSGAASGIASISLAPSGITLSKIIAVSVLVDTSGSGDWVPPSTSLTGAFDYNWKINSAGPSLDVTNGAASSGIWGKTIKVLITYEQ